GTTDGNNGSDDPFGALNMPMSWRGVLHAGADTNYPTAGPGGSDLPPDNYWVNYTPNYSRRETFATITDGTSNTIMTGEYATSTTLARGPFSAYDFTRYALS